MTFPLPDKAVEAGARAMMLVTAQAAQRTATRST
jgi:hypothetical protein